MRKEGATKGNLGSLRASNAIRYGDTEELNLKLAGLRYFNMLSHFSVAAAGFLQMYGWESYGRLTQRSDETMLLLGWVSAAIVIGIHCAGMVAVGASEDKDGRTVAVGLMLEFAATLCGIVPALLICLELPAGGGALAGMGAKEAVVLFGPLVPLAASGIPLGLYRRALWSAGQLTIKDGIPTLFKLKV